MTKAQTTASLESKRQLKVLQDAKFEVEQRLEQAAQQVSGGRWWYGSLKERACKYQILRRRS